MALPVCLWRAITTGGTMNRTQTVVAVTCLVIGCGWLYAGGNGRVDSVQQGGGLPDTAVFGWDYSTFDVKYGGPSAAVILAGPGCVHKVFVLPEYFNNTTITLYDANSVGDVGGRKIVSFLVAPGQNFELPLDVRVRRGLVLVSSYTQSAATVLYHAD